MKKRREDDARLLKVHKQSAIAKCNSDTCKQKKFLTVKVMNHYNRLLREALGLFMLGDAQDSAGQALNNLL